MENQDYGSEGVIWHAYSPRLMKKIIELFPKEIPVIDLGCGLNNYVNILCYLGYEAHGYDYTDLGSKNFTIANLAYPLYPVQGKTKFIKNVISLEVGEHIPEHLADVYLDNLTMHGGDIIMSWAVEGQAGIGHVNCRNNDWVIVEMHKRGYKLEGNRTADLRAAVADCHANWFKETLMYFIPAYF